MSESSLPDWAANIPPYRVRCPDSFPTTHRILDRHTLLETIASIKKAGLSTALTSGSFDLTHLGHAKYLEAASRLADILIVGVDSDEKVRRRKGEDRPWYSEYERAYMVANNRGVDWVTIKQADDPRWTLIKAVQPDVLILTDETYSTNEQQELAKYVGSTIVLGATGGISTSRRISHLHSLQIKNTADLDQERQNDYWP